MKVGKKLRTHLHANYAPSVLRLSSLPRYFFLRPVESLVFIRLEKEIFHPRRDEKIGVAIFSTYICIFLPRNFVGTGLTQPWPPSDRGKSRFDEYDRAALFGLHRRANRKEERRSSPPLRHSFLPGRLLERAATRRKKVISETLSAPRDCLQGVGEGERKGLVQIFFRGKGRGSKRNSSDVWSGTSSSRTRSRKVFVVDEPQIKKWW